MKTERFSLSTTGSVGDPHLTTYILDDSPSMKIKKRPFILICPGGGYRFVSDREGEVLALQFSAMGYHTGVLTYSVAPAVYPVQLKETALAFSIIQKNAQSWNVLGDRIVIAGCSAGGHLAASYSLFYQEELVCGETGLAPEKLRPAGMILSYPVISSGEFAHQDSFAALLGDSYEHLKSNSLFGKLSLETQVTSDTPPAFLWHTFTDNLVPVENSLLFAMALRRVDVPTELHIFPAGGHGLALANELTLDQDGYGIQKECQIWIDLAKVWLHDLVGVGL